MPITTGNTPAALGGGRIGRRAVREAQEREMAEHVLSKPRTPGATGRKAVREAGEREGAQIVLSRYAHKPVEV